MQHRKTYMHTNFQRNWVHRSVKTVHTLFLQKKCKFMQFATCSKNFQKSRLWDMHYSIMNIQSDSEINRPTRYQITKKRNYFHRR